MRAPSWRALLAVAALTAFGLISARAADDKVDLKGNWKFTLVSPFNENDLMILNVKDDDGKSSADVKDAIPLPQPLTLTKFDAQGDKVTFAFTLVGNEATFSGTAGKDGKVRGTMRFQGQTIPAHLEKTEDAKLTPARPDQTIFQSFFAARAERDAKAKVKKFEEMVQKAPGSPKMSAAYGELVKAAADADLPEAKVRGYVNEWVDGARAYGPEYASDVQSQALKALNGRKPYANLSLALASEADKSLDKDSPLETRADVAKALASAARLAGKDELAKTASERADKLEAQLDAEYHEKVPPFKPEVSLGRKEKKSDRVVLLELFTGAQCPPCVAADVAFDALIKTYKPSELVTLQYHLHIPGPDPLTNADSAARQQYYPDLRGTPSTYFNGKSEAYGGGGMGQAKGKYDQYRQLIDNALSGGKKATIDLQVSRKGDEIKVVATAQAEAGKKAEGARTRRKKAAPAGTRSRHSSSGWP